MLRSLIFDFDGLILDTETPEVDVWKAIYADYGVDFPLDRWAGIIGGYGISDFDAANYLVELASDGVEAAALRLRHRSASDALPLLQPVLPGVAAALHEAQRLNLK